MLSSVPTTRTDASRGRLPTRHRRPLSRGDRAAMALGVMLTAAMLLHGAWRVGRHVLRDRIVTPGKSAEQQHAH